MAIGYKLTLKSKKKIKVIDKKKNMAIELGKENLLPNCDDFLLGLKVGEKKEFPLKVAEDYADSRFAGKELSIQVTINNAQYYELPKIDDELARDVGEYETLTDLKKVIQDNIKEQLKKIQVEKGAEQLLSQILEKTKIELPPKLLNREKMHQLNELTHLYNRYIGNGHKHYKLPELAEIMGKKVEELEKELEGHAQTKLKKYFVIEKIAKEEKIEAREEDIVTYIQEKGHGEETEQLLKRVETDENFAITLRENVVKEKTCRWLYEKAKIEQGEALSWQDFLKDLQESSVKS